MLPLTNDTIALWNIRPLRRLAADLVPHFIYPATWGTRVLPSLGGLHNDNVRKARVEKTLCEAIDCLDRGIAVSVGLGVTTRDAFKDLSEEQRTVFCLLIGGSAPQVVERKQEALVISRSRIPGRAKKIFHPAPMLDVPLMQRIAVYDGYRQEFHDRVFNDDERDVMQEKLRDNTRIVSRNMPEPLFQMLSHGNVESYAQMLRFQLLPEAGAGVGQVGAKTNFLDGGQVRTRKMGNYGL